MNFQEKTKLILKNKWLIFWLIVFGAILSFDLSLIQTPQFKSTSKVLIIQKQTEGQDIYTISKSAQYLARSLRESIYSDSFFNQIVATSEEISPEDFPTQLKDRRKIWQNNIDVKIFQDLGVMTIDVFSINAERAKDINQAIINHLVQNNQLYHGSGDSVSVKVLDEPAVLSKDPVKPNLWVASILGAIIGFLIGLLLALRKNNKRKPTKKSETSPLARNVFYIPNSNPNQKGGF